MTNVTVKDSKFNGAVELTDISGHPGEVFRWAGTDSYYLVLRNGAGMMIVQTKYTSARWTVVHSTVARVAYWVDMDITISDLTEC